MERAPQSRNDSEAERAYREEPSFDENEHLDDEDKTVADSFPASDPPATY